MPSRLYLLLLLMSGHVACATPGGHDLGREGPWHACERDDQPTPCKASYLDGMVELVWQDGYRTRLRCVGSCGPKGTVVDESGGRWTHEVFPQGNSRYTHTKTDSSIFVPLRPPRPLLER